MCKIYGDYSDLKIVVIIINLLTFYNIYKDGQCTINSGFNIFYIFVKAFLKEY